MQKKLKGLTNEEVSKSREKYGSNSLEKEKTKSLIAKLFENLTDPIIRVLLIAVGIEVIFTFGNCNWLEVGGIILAVLVATFVSCISEYGSERAFEKMQSEAQSRTSRVLREGNILEVPESEVVVGDILYIGSGEQISADGFMIEGSVTVDQSALNGESRDVIKTSGRISEDVADLSSQTHVFKGSLVRSGQGIMQVSSVGASTHYGMVAKDVQTETRESPLKLRLSALASFISKLGYIMAVVVGLTYLFYAYVVDNNFQIESIIASFQNIPYVITTLTHALTLMITVIVVAVPEGLPMMITVVLSANMKRMSQDMVLVKKLVGIETAGSMNILFTDKTGTLTEGKSQVERIITGDGVYKSVTALKTNSAVYEKLLISAKYSVDVELGEVTNSTDKALFKFFEKEEARQVDITNREPFTSENKYSSVTLSNGVKIVKGAPELLLQSCSSLRNKDGDNIVGSLNSIIAEYKAAARRGERVIAICESDCNENYVFLALVVLKDKLRPGVREAVEKITHAGVQVVMITGDSKETATAIAMECGILRYGVEDSVKTREELANMTDDEVMAILPKLRVVSRALPSDKTRLVRLSQKLNLVVGMTGDGINDAPSLKLADVGFAMGSGTEIAKSAGDIVILDNSFLAIVKTVLYGRTIFKSIRKFIAFQLMMNITACGVSLLGQFIGIDNPITIIQMLWINIIMDTLGGLAFSGEAPLDYYMLEKPKSREEKILSHDMLHQILFTGGYTLLLCVSFLYFDFFKLLFRASTDDSFFLSGFYALFVFAGIFNCFNARGERLWLFTGINKNKLFLIIMGMISVVQILMIYFGGEIFRAAPLTFRELLNVILLAATVIPVDFIRRIIKKISYKKEKTASFNVNSTSKAVNY